MFQTDQPSAASSLPAPAVAGTQGFFTNGNPVSGIPATILDADFMNMLMMELINIVEAAGLTPSKTAYNQVLTAIRALKGYGDLLSVNMYATQGSVIFTPSTPNSLIYTRAMGGGAAGGSTPATGAGQYAIASGGSTGAYAEGIYQLTSAAPIPITIGAGGVTAAGAAGGNGGTTSIGSLITCPGGVGGSTSGLQSTSIPWTTGTTLAPVATGGNICNSQGWPGSFGMAIQVSAGTAGLVAGGGGPSPLGNSIAATQGPPGTGGIAGILGGGGRGAAQGPSSPLVGGGNGGAGWGLIFEFGSK
ncbi:hypothetical protein ACFSHT_15990 [Paraburkholderia silviterrae]|uniref:Uncharacterized protein n=1 Tax=Paraburkholderia silviterrae TaxID=2528715 RepID=A0A4V2ZZ11_9BURK|nr:hypothetical protein [Paraburkholderia silviterrae]TDG23208.1 hypothetical protein EYW47_14845 [Paraburkholderia silviterrae]